MMTLYVHQILMPDQMFPEHLKDNEGALPSPVCSCVRVKRKCSSLPRALNIKCAAKLSFFLPFSLNQSPFTVFNIFFSAQNIHEIIMWSQQNEIKFCIFNLFHQQNFDIGKVDSNFWKCKSQFSDKIVSIMYRGSAILQASSKNCSKIAKRRSLRNINTSGIAYLKCILTKKKLFLQLLADEKKTAVMWCLSWHLLLSGQLFWILAMAFNKRSLCILQKRWLRSSEQNYSWTWLTWNGTLWILFKKSVCVPQGTCPENIARIANAVQVTIWL